MAKQPHCHRDGPRVEARETRGQRPAYGGANPRKRAPRGAVAATLVVLALAAVAAAVHPTLAAVVSADGPSAGRLAGPGDLLPNHNEYRMQTRWLNKVPFVLKDVDTSVLFSVLIRGTQTRFFASGSCV